MIHTCSSCKIEFKAKAKNRRYCSRKCFDNRNKHWTTRECLHCSKQFKSYPNKINSGGGKYCSTLCRSLHTGTKVKRWCKVCEKEFIVKRKAIENSGAMYCSHKCMWIGQKGIKKPSIQGEKAPNWRGGIQFYPYPFSFNDELKECVRKRDNYSCRICGFSEEEHIIVLGYRLHIHHIDYVKENCLHDNLISLCSQCHGRTNYNRSYWEEVLKIMMGKIKGGVDISTPLF